ncbi:Rossmann-like domain-containing protein [Kaarinaea lacus]
MHSNPWEVYDLLLERIQTEAVDTIVKDITIGLTWTLCQSHGSQGEGIGLAMSPQHYTRTLPWSGTLVDRPLTEVAAWIKSWNPFEAAIGLAAANAALNTKTSSLAAEATQIPTTNSPNLSVFDYFLPKLKNKKVVVIGRYPGLEKYESQLQVTVLERNPLAGDFPDSACEYVVPNADWVFLTASSIANKTFPRLAELSQNAVTVLMGPSVPWLHNWVNYGVDYIAGVRVSSPDALRATVAEGGGVRIFDQAVQYHVLDLGQSTMQGLKTDIANLVTEREQLKAEMDAWYGQTSSNKSSRFPKWSLLEQIDRDLSVLDLRYKRQWDARHSA